MKRLALALGASASMYALLCASNAHAQQQPSSSPPAPVPVEAPVSSSAVTTASPGQGFTIRDGNAFSATFKARLQLRDTLTIPESGDALHDIQLRTLRLSVSGFVLNPNVRYTVQLALAPRDFESGNPSPVYDAFLELTHSRDLSVRVGQFFVPFDRARTIRESTLQTLDRSQMLTELSLDRDVGVMVFSDDLFAWGGRLTYRLGIFGGDGRNRANPTGNGELLVARVAVRPFGSFDDDHESDLLRHEEPKLAVGFGIAHNRATDRPQSTTGTPYTFARFDYTHVAADLVFKWHGFSLLGEFLWRGASARSRDGTVNMMPVTEASREGWGFLAQAAYLWTDELETFARFDHLAARSGTDRQLASFVSTRGNGVTLGANYYVHGHALKVQADWAHFFGDSYDTIAQHLVRLQLDASF